MHKFNIESYWYTKQLRFFTILLLPLSWLFLIIVTLRRTLYRFGVIKTFNPTVPVIIVGNITVGGTGKTPFVIWLVQFLQKLGYKPAIISRGVGGKKRSVPKWVEEDDLPLVVGDEALLLKRHGACPVLIGRDRVAAVKQLVAHTDCNIIISDDGLQHYRLGRTLEIAMIDETRALGNRQLLPAGPLREPPGRLKNVDYKIINGEAKKDAFYINLVPNYFVSVMDPSQRVLFGHFKYKKFHAVAAIGHPERFFQSLRQAGFDIIPHSFPDHHLFQFKDLQFNDDLPIVMTEKDAVKCTQIADERFWYVGVSVNVSQNLIDQLSRSLNYLNLPPSRRRGPIFN